MEEVVSNGRKITTIMNNYLANAIKHLNPKANKISHREKLVNIFGSFKNRDSMDV